MFLSATQGGNTNFFVTTPAFHHIFVTWLGFAMECKSNVLFIQEVRSHGLGSRGSGIINHCSYSLRTEFLPASLCPRHVLPPTPVQVSGGAHVALR